MYRGTKAIRSWTMAGLLTVASGVGIVAVSHSLQTPLTVVANPAPTSSTAATVNLATLKAPVGGEDGYRPPVAGSTIATTHFYDH